VKWNLRPRYVNSPFSTLNYPGVRGKHFQFEGHTYIYPRRINLKIQLAVTAVLVVMCLVGASAQQPITCAAPEHRQLDFWVGDWDVFEADGVTEAAHVQVEKILGGCVLREVYEDPTGLQGESISIYDASRELWHQAWVTNRGQLLTIEGRWQENSMVLTGSYRAEGGRQGLVRGTWKAVADGVRETTLKSVDNGETWQTWFDLVFRPRAQGTAASEDGIIARLDKEYQAAVKHNDAANMDRILADDFVLVTGTGNKITKPDLLAQARSGRISYEQQDELEQFVRVWGNAAVVTGKLWEKGTDDGTPFDYKLWFSDTYIRTPAGWRYVFGQASRPLDSEPCLGKNVSSN
jgi:ketosteroid isomerase-like protein